MKIYIFGDMEGISGITQNGHVTASHALYPLGCKLFTLDINACIEGCFQAGAEKVIVRDGHSNGVNINPLEIDQRATLIQGNSGRERFPMIDDCDGLILLGYHGMAGTENAILEHTFSSANIQNIWLNNQLVGEFAIDAIIAAEHRVPTIMVSGDDKVCAEARTLLPDVVTCQVKQALTTYGAALLAPQQAHKLITAKTVAAIKQLPAIALPEVPTTICLKREVVERGMLPPMRPGIKHLDGRTYETTGTTLEAALFANL